MENKTETRRYTFLDNMIWATSFKENFRDSSRRRTTRRQRQQGTHILPPRFQLIFASGGGGAATIAALLPLLLLFLIWPLQQTYQQVEAATTAAAAAAHLQAQPSTTQITQYSHNKQNSYYGTLIGKLIRRDHNVSGDVYAVDEQTLFIKGFNYDGLAPDAYFWSSVTSSQPSAEGGFIVPDEKGSTKPLERYIDKDVVLRLPEGKTLREINWLSIWSRHNKQNSGEIFIGKQSIIPRPLEIGPFSSLAHGLKSGPITIVDAQTFLVPDFHYDGKGPDAYFWLTRGSQGLNVNGLRLKDENGSGSPLKKYSGETVVITLPEELTIYDFDYFGVWCQQYSVNFGQTKIPQLARVPPSPKMLGIKPENKLNCEILYDDLGYEIRWVLDGDDIVMQLVGKIEPNEYMAFGLGKDDSKSDMNNADAVVTWVDRHSGQVHAVDYYLAGKQQCVNDPLTGSCPDVKLQGGGDSLILLHGAIVNGYSMVTFKRPQLGIDDQYDQHVYSDGQQSVIWAIGTLNSKKEIGYHRLKTRHNMFIDFARNPQWNCPIPDLNASIHNNLPISSAASQIDPTVVSATLASAPSVNEQAVNNVRMASVGTESLESQSRPLQVSNSIEDSRAAPATTISSSSSSDDTNPDTQPTRATPTLGTQASQTENSGQPISNKTAEHNAPWFIPSIACPSDRTFYAQIGPTAGHKGYEGLTGRTSWGISWYVNGLMIPELVVERGQTYRFIVEGGNDKTSTTRRHPFYLTDSQEGGFDFKTDDERLKERIFGGVALRPDGQFVPTAEGRLCEWKHTNNTLTNPDSYPTFSAYQRTLKMECLPGQASMLKFSPDSTTPDFIYYQCYTHRFMGWRIRVVNSCQSYLSSLATQQTATSQSRTLNINSKNNNKRDTRLGSRLGATEAKSTYKRRSLTVPPSNILFEVIKAWSSEPRVSFESPNAQHFNQQQQQLQQPPPQPQNPLSFQTESEFGDDTADSSLFGINDLALNSMRLNEMLVLNNSHIANLQKQPYNASILNEILKLSPEDVEFIDPNQAASDPLDSFFLQTNFGLSPMNGLQSIQNHTTNSNNINNLNTNSNKTTKGPKMLHSYIRRLASIYYPVQQQLASMLTSPSATIPNNANSATNSQSNLTPNQLHSTTLVQMHPTIPPLQTTQTSTQPNTPGFITNESDHAASPSGVFSLSNLVPKSKIDLSKSTISKKLNKFRFKSGRKYEPMQASGSQNQTPKQHPPTPANEFNYDIFNNQLAALEKQQKQFQALELANWPPTSDVNQASTNDALNYLPIISPGNSGEQTLHNPIQYDYGNNQLHTSQKFINSLLNNNHQQQQSQQHPYPLPTSSMKQQTTANPFQHLNPFVQQQQQQPFFRQPLRLSEIPLGPPNQSGHQPYMIDYLSMSFNKTGEMPTVGSQNQPVRLVSGSSIPTITNSWPMNSNQPFHHLQQQHQQQQQQQQQYNQQQQQSQPAVFITRIPHTQGVNFGPFSKPQQVNHQHHTATAPSQQDYQIWNNIMSNSNKLSTPPSARYPNIQPYQNLPIQTLPNSGVYTSLEQEFNSNNNNNNQISTMPSLALSTHDTHSPEPGAFHSQHHQNGGDTGQHDTVESLTGSGSASQFDFRHQQPILKATANSDQQQQQHRQHSVSDLSSMSSMQSNGGAMSNIEPTDHMMAIERFSKQSSERSPPSIVHPITGEQIHHLTPQFGSHLHLVNQQQQQPSMLTQSTSNNNSNHTKNQQQQFNKPRFSAMLIDKHIVASSGEPMQATNDILETDQSMHHPSQDLQRINVSETQYHQLQQEHRSNSNKQPQLVLMNVDSDKIQRMGSANGSSTFITLHKEQIVDGNINSSKNPNAEQTPTTEASVSAVLVKPNGNQQQDAGSSSFGVVDPVLDQSAGKITSSTTTTSTISPLIPSFGPPTVTSFNQNSNSLRDASQEMILSPTLAGSTTSSLVYNPSIGPPRQQQPAVMYPHSDHFFNKPTFDSSPFTPLELVNHIYYPNNTQFRTHPDLLPANLASSGPPIDSILARHHRLQDLYPKPEPPVQVASFLAQHLTAHNPLFISSEKSVASNQPMALSVSIPPLHNSKAPNIPKASSNIFGMHNNSYPAAANELIILKPALLTKHAPQTYLLKPEYITNHLRLNTHNDDLHKVSQNNQGQDLYYSNEISNEPSRRIAGNQFDRLSSLSSSPSTSIALDPMLTATNMAFNTYIKQSIATDNNLADARYADGKQQASAVTSSDKLNEKAAPSEISKSNSSLVNLKENVTTINVEASQTIPDSTKLSQHRQSPIPVKPIPLNLEPLSSFTPDGVRLSSTGISNSESIHRDNNTDNAILSHVMSLISSNAIPTPPFIPVASYSSADYFLPYSDRLHRSIRG